VCFPRALPGGFLQIRRHLEVSAITLNGRTERTKIMPVDFAVSDPGLAAMRAQIERAVAPRDASMLLPVLGPQVQVNFESSYTPREFVALQKSCAGSDRIDFWRELHDAISLGMARHPAGGVIAPYVFVKATGVETLVITGSRVALRSAPDPEAPAVDWLSYDVVQRSPGDVWEDRSRPVRIQGFEYGWVPVVSPSGKSGWVSEKYARSVIATRLSFQKIGGEWKLVAIIAGD
jgi:hypothetical protein